MNVIRRSMSGASSCFVCELVSLFVEYDDGVEVGVPEAGWVKRCEGEGSTNSTPSCPTAAAAGEARSFLHPNLLESSVSTLLFSRPFLTYRLFQRIIQAVWW